MEKYKATPAPLRTVCTMLLRDVAVVLVDPPRYARKKPGAKTVGVVKLATPSEPLVTVSDCSRTPPVVGFGA